jgi:hypothetical protein
MCCLSNLNGDELECEDRTESQCAAEGGVSKGAGVCAETTCDDIAPPTPEIMCCVTSHSGTEIDCEDHTGRIAPRRAA